MLIKFLEHSRWEIEYLEVTENTVTVTFQSFSDGRYLAEKEDGSGVELIEIAGETSIEEIPAGVPMRAKWSLNIAGSALSPGQVTFITFAPFIFAMGFITGGEVFL